MDLSGQPRIAVDYADDEVTGLTTITFAPAADWRLQDDAIGTALGSITIETDRARALMEALVAVAKERTTDWDARLHPIVKYLTHKNRCGVRFG